MSYSICQSWGRHEPLRRYSVYQIEQPKSLSLEGFLIRDEKIDFGNDLVQTTRMILNNLIPAFYLFSINREILLRARDILLQLLAEQLKLSGEVYRFSLNATGPAISCRTSHISC